jgi:hypothetical protein
MMAELTLEDIKSALGHAYNVEPDYVAPKKNPLSSYKEGFEIAPQELSLEDLSKAIQQAYSPETINEPAQTGLLPNWLNTGVQTGMGVLSGMTTPIVGGMYGLARSIPEAISTGQAPQPIAQKYAEQFIQQHPGYKVTDPQAQANLETVQQAFEASKLPPVMPEGLQMSKGGAGLKEIITATKANMPKLRIAKSGAEAQLANQFGQKGQNIGAAQATSPAILKGNIDAAIANASPELQSHINAQLPENVNVPALETKALEEKHGVNLTTGQRIGDTQLYSQEWNRRGETPTLGSHFESQPQQIAEAFEQSKQRHAPDIPSTADAAELGQHEINALSATDAKRVDNINSAYQALKDKWQELRGTTGTDDFPVDGKQFLDNARAELKNELLHHDVPDSISKILDELDENNGQMGFSQFLKLNQKLGQKMKEGSGSERAAAFVIRQELQKIPLVDEAAQLKPLADNAISLAKERFDTIKASPAYKAAIKEAADAKEAASGESLNAEKFHNKFVSNETAEAIRRMKAEIAPDDIAHQAIAFGELDRAKNSALNASQKNLTPEQFAKFLRNNKSGLMESLSPQAMQDVTELGLLTSKIGMPKTGTFNYSNTFSSQLAEMAKQGLLTIGESKLAGATGGASIPAVGITKQFIQKMNKEGFARQATHPFGGLTKE